jgi:transcriptional regulator GlxA family with amidase domain
MQSNCQRYFGFSPRGHLTECRLENARQILLAPRPDSTVNAVAFDSGFTNLACLAAKYRGKFGGSTRAMLRQN